MGVATLVQAVVCGEHVQDEQKGASRSVARATINEKRKTEEKNTSPLIDLHTFLLTAVVVVVDPVSF